jgi:pilin isopeptide linkage protein
MRWKIAKAAVLLLAAAMTIGTGRTVSAGAGADVDAEQAMEDLDPGKSSSLTICFHTSVASGEKPISGAEFSIYQVADVSVSKFSDGNTTYTLTSDFSGTTVGDKTISFIGMDADASNRAAEAFAKTAAEKSLNPTAPAAMTGEDGTVTFENLPFGAYLVRETASADMAANYTRIAPYLVLVPEIIPSGDSSKFNSWGYSVTSEPKSQVDPKSDAVVDISVIKIVKGEAAPDAAFCFELQAADVASPMPSDSKNGVKELIVSGAGQYSFGNIVYGTAGTYRYTCKEINTGLKGFTYDATTYDITVRVTGEDADALNAAVTIMRGDESVGGVIFTNQYTPEGGKKTDEGGHHDDENPPSGNPGTSPGVYPGVSEIQVVKTVSGDIPPEDAEFHFLLEADSVGNYMPGGSADGTKEIAIVGAGSGSFGVTGYYKSGVYTYTVRERNTGESGYTFDDSVYRVTVTVTDVSAAKDGTVLSAQTIYTKNGQKVSGITFDNKYMEEKGADSNSRPLSTGDSSRMALYGVVSLAAAAVLAVFIRLGKRNK